MTRPIAATLTRCRHSQPLVVLDSQPFNGMEVRPDDLRHMAQQLMAMADMADSLPVSEKHFHPVKVQIGTDASGKGFDLLSAAGSSLDAIFGSTTKSINPKG